jgi:hypothetical protein
MILPLDRDYDYAFVAEIHKGRQIARVERINRTLEGARQIDATRHQLIKWDFGYFRGGGHDPSS